MWPYGDPDRTFVTVTRPHRATSRRAFALLIGLAAVSAVELHAQCPDGTPPPCRGAVGPIARRAAIALNTRAYIVVPFTNVMKAPDLEWLHDASVNLLSLDIGRWTDVSVIPDKRVDDLLRELPRAKSGELSLNDGLTIARRAGAGMLVMGDYYRLGKGARVVANVFDVRTGNRLRSIEHQAADQDSLLTAFGPIARGVLAVPPPPDAKTGVIGTTRVDAYQEYLAGVKALNHFDVEPAKDHLQRALAIDSTFALAHLQLAIALEWGESSADGRVARVHALAAQRFGASLPPRERALITSEVAVVDNDYTNGCIALAPLVAKDSNDVQALFLFGDCSFHDNTVERGQSDTVPGRFRGDWNASLRAFRRVLQLDPAYYAAFPHILNILGAYQRVGCVKRPPDQCDVWEAAVLRSEDTLEIRPVSDARNKHGWYAQSTRSARERPVLANLLDAKRYAEDWVGADSTQEEAHFGLATVLLRLGDLAAADAQLRLAHVRAVPREFDAMRLEIELAAKQGRGAVARAWFDSLVKAIPDVPVPSRMVLRGGFELMFGRFGRVVPGLRGLVANQGPEAQAYVAQIPRVLLGVPGPDVGKLELARYAAMRDTACDSLCRINRLFPTLVYALRLPRTTWPAFPSRIDDDRLGVAYALSRGDTTHLRMRAWEHDSLARRNVSMGWPDFQWSVVATEGYLALHDSAAALRSARFYVDTAMVVSPLIDNASFGISTASMWVRMMLLRADLAAAAGYKDEARKWYDRVLDLWANADPELQPEMNRIRAAVAALGPPA